jgi:hypothetical protein
VVITPTSTASSAVAECRVDYLVKPGLGRGFDSDIFTSVRTQVIRSRLRMVTETQEYFQQLRGLGSWTKDDAVAVGEAMLLTTTATAKTFGRGTRLSELFERHKGLREVQDRFDWFETLMLHVVENRLSLAGKCGSRLCNVSLKDAEIMGKSLASSIAVNTGADAAVDEWIHRFGALEELAHE